MKKQQNSRYLFLLFFLIVLVVAFLIVRPFLSTLIVAAIVAYIIYPIYRYFCRLTQMKRFSAVILLLMLFLLLSIPFLLIIGKLSRESYDAYSRVKEVFLGSQAFQTACADGEGVVCSTYLYMKSIDENYNLDLGFHLAQGFSSIASKGVGKASDFILNIPGLLLNIFVMIFALYYMLVDGKNILVEVKKTLPLKPADSTRILQHFNDVIYATIYGAIVIAIVQGLVATIGYLIFGVSSPIILGLMTVVAAFIPFVGATIVWLPVGVSMFINGIILDDTTMMWKSAGLIIYGFAVVATIDNLIRPKLVGDRARIHPLVILLGVFGGIGLFGFVGIMVGPLLLTLFMASLKIYQQEKNHIH